MEISVLLKMYYFEIITDSQENIKNISQFFKIEVKFTCSEMYCFQIIQFDTF
jgi:hypothetical protein